MASTLIKGVRLPPAMGVKTGTTNLLRAWPKVSHVGTAMPTRGSLGSVLMSNPRLMRRKQASKRLQMLTAAPASARPATAAAAAKRMRAHELLDDDIVSDCCLATVRKLQEADPLKFLPAPIHELFHMHEALAALLLREFIFAAMVLIVIIFRNRILRSLNMAWSRWILRDFEVTEMEYERSLFSTLSNPLALALASTTVCRLVELLGPYVKVYPEAALLEHVKGLSLVFAFAWFLLSWKKNLILSATETRADKSRLYNLDKLGTLFICTLAVLCAAEVTGLALRSLVAIGGVSSFAVGFAAKAVLSNFAGGMMLYITQPFRVGDSIKAGGYSGKVLDIGFYSTKLLSKDLEPIFVPNDAFTNQAITNFSRADKSVLSATFMLRTQRAILIVNKITQQVEKMLKAHPAVDLSAGSAYCALKALNHDCLDLTISCVLRDMSSERFYKTQQEILVKTAEIVIESGGLLASVYEPSVVAHASAK